MSSCVVRSESDPPPGNSIAFAPSVVDDLYNCIIGGASAILRRVYVRRRASIRELRRTYCSCLPLSWQRRRVGWEAAAAGVTAALLPVAGGRRQMNRSGVRAAVVEEEI